MSLDFRQADDISSLNQPGPQRGSDGEFKEMAPLCPSETITGVTGSKLSLVAAIEEIRTMREEMRALGETALSAKRAKDEFLATLDHETRTPINGIYGMVNFLLGTELDSEQKEYVGSIVTSSQRMLEVVNNLSIASHLSAPTKKLRSDPFSFNELVEGIESYFRRIGNERLLLKVIIDESLPEVARGDEHRIREILKNLVSNAVKFTDSGVIELEISQVREDEARHELEFSVSDPGGGISPEILEKLFQPFSQADSSITRRHDGMGLGLAISKSMAELMDGCIEVESRVGEGSKFTFRCKVDKWKGSSGQLMRLKKLETEGEPPQIAVKPKSVLVVEDNPLNQKITKKMLENIGCIVTVANNGLEALEMTSGGLVFDLILMDLCMPELDGFEASRRIRLLDTANATVPIIAVTGLSREEDFEKCREAGLNHCLTKPVDHKMLSQCVDDPLFEGKEACCG